jgi:hypothetical protein
MYLLNAALPKSGAVRIDRQTRNANQSVGEIDFTVQPARVRAGAGVRSLR